jgi:hypothetical protein
VANQHRHTAAGTKMHAASRAFVVHCTPTRIRIKIPERQRQEAYFTALRRALLQHPDVLGVHANPLTASVVIECRDGFAFLTQNHHFPGLELRPVQTQGPARNQLPTLTHGPDSGHSSPTGTIGLAAVLIKLLVALATKQLGAQLIDWVVAAVVRAASAERDRLARLPMLLVALAE